jgi:hypothetical protein
LSKSLVDVVYGKYLNEAFGLAFMSLNAISLKKTSGCLTWWRKQNKNMFYQT